MTRPASRTLLLALVLGACAATGLSVIPAKGARPAWADLRDDVEYPRSRFVLGVGQLSESDAAGPDAVAALDAAARRELSKTIQVEVRGTVESFASSSTRDDKTTLVETVTSATSERVSMQLSDVQIVARWRDGKQGVAYALAALDRAAAVTSLGAQAGAKASSAASFAAKGTDAALDAGTRLRALIKARDEADAALSLALLRRTIARDAAELPDLTRHDAALAAALNELSLQPAEGDAQRVADGKPLQRPLVVRAEQRSANGSATPVAGLPVSFELPNGTKESVTTGPDGLARWAPVKAVTLAAPKAQAKARADLVALARSAEVGGTEPPAWVKSLRSAEAAFSLVRQGLASTRVVVMVQESIEEVGPQSPSGTASAAEQALGKLGFEVRDRSVVAKALGGEEAAVKTPDAELAAKLSPEADVVVVGTAESRFHKKFAGQVVHHKVRVVVRAIDAASGRMLHGVDVEIPCPQFGQGPEKAGKLALKHAAETVAAGFAENLKKAMGL